MKSKRVTGLFLSAAVILSWCSAQAGLITFSNIKERGGSARDAEGADVTLSGFTSGNLGIVAGTHTQTITVSGIDFATGLTGGTDSFSFDLIQSSAVGSVQFRNTSGVLLGTYQPLTVTVTNFQVLAGTGEVSFSKITSAVVYMLDTINNSDIIKIYDGVSTSDPLIATELRNGVSAHNVALPDSTQSSITVFREAGLTTDYFNGLSFQVNVIPEPATVGMLGLGGLIVVLVRRFNRR